LLVEKLDFPQFKDLFEKRFRHIKDPEEELVVQNDSDESAKVKDAKILLELVDRLLRDEKLEVALMDIFMHCDAKDVGFVDKTSIVNILNKSQELTTIDCSLIYNDLVKIPVKKLNFPQFKLFFKERFRHSQELEEELIDHGGGEESAKVKDAKILLQLADRLFEKSHRWIFCLREVCRGFRNDAAK
jgi:hypothetical protein